MVAHCCCYRRLIWRGAAVDFAVVAAAAIDNVAVGG